MNILKLIIFIFFGLFCCFSIVSTKKSNNFLRPCYFTNWAQYRLGRAKFEPEDYVPRLCTHIFYAFGSFNSSFIPTPSDPADLPNDSDPIGLYGRVNGLKKFDPQLKTLLSFGGWTFSTETTLFNNMTANSTSRSTFINASIAFLRKYDFDGIDFDWEYPDSNENFNALLKTNSTCSSEFVEAAEAEACSNGRPRLLVVAAVSASINTANNSYDIATIAKYLDFVNLMSYDFHGTWECQTGFNSPLYANDTLNIEAAAAFWNEQGMPKSKIIIGIPTYGHGWTLSNPGNETGVGAPASGAALPTEFVQSAGTGAYYEFCEMLANGSISHFNKTSKVPYLVYEGDQWFSYEDVRSVKAKVKFVKANKYGGAYVWTLDFDDFNGKCPNSKMGLYPLIGIIARKLGGIKIKQKPVSAIMMDE